MWCTVRCHACKCDEAAGGAEGDADNGGHLVSPPPEEVSEEAYQRLRQSVLVLQGRLQASQQVAEANGLLRAEVERLTAELARHQLLVAPVWVLKRRAN